ncbi:MAG: hypothetical protein BAJATHORv1_50131 [Candidatus Thorarchaeota archaeon]|nr:MAG: hypothetical protein BAJATHORv1_50131 [Candidatus Thorarchaeota archaeon]
MVKISGSTFIIGHLGHGNAGDDAILLSFLLYLSNNLNESLDLTIFAPNSYLRYQLGNLKNLNIHFVQSYLDFFKHLIVSKNIVLNGGDYLDDYGSIQKRLNTYLKFVMISTITSLFRNDFLIINSGFRIRSTFGSVMTRFILRWVSRISVRDSESLSSLNQISNIDIYEGFDTAVLLDTYYDDYMHSLSYEMRKGHTAKIGVSITPYHQNFFGNPQKDRLFAKKTAEFLDYIISKYPTIELYLISFNMSNHMGDMKIINMVLYYMKTRGFDRVRIIQYNGKLVEFLSKLSLLNGIICSKYHSIVFSYLLSKPILIFPYHPKCLALAKMIEVCDESILECNESNHTNFLLSFDRFLKMPGKYIPALEIMKAKKKAEEGIRWCL